MSKPAKPTPGQANTDHKAPSEPASRKLQAPGGNRPAEPSNAPGEPTALATQKQGGRGAPKGNRNAIRHGLRAGTLPADAKYIENRLNEFRRNLEDGVLAAKQEVSIADAAAIQTAIRWERHACLAQRWLTKQYADLKPIDRLAFSREISRASSERDKAIRLLGLDVNRQEDWHTILVGPEPEQPEAEQ